MRFLLSILALSAAVYILASVAMPSGQTEADRAEAIDMQWRSRNAKTPPDWFVMRTPVKGSVPSLDQFVIESN